MKIQLSEPFFIFTVLKKAWLERYSLISSLHSYSSYFPIHPTCNSTKSCGTKRPSEKKYEERRFICHYSGKCNEKKKQWIQTQIVASLTSSYTPSSIWKYAHHRKDVVFCPVCPHHYFWYLYLRIEYQMFNSHIFSLAPKAYRINHRHRQYAMSALKAHMICQTSKSEYYFIRGRHMNCV